MLSDFETFVSKNKLFSKKDKLLVAISGGKDSICLFHLLLKNNYHFELAHCNYQLRGKDSDGDESFLKKLASKHKIKLHVIRFDTKAEAIKSKTGIQETARNLRYEWFEQLRQTEVCKYIVTAHHQTDHTETILINIFRSTGISGLHGIPLKNGHIVRPMMFAGMEGISAYLNKKRLIYRHDTSNDKDNYLRNRIRHNVLPALNRIDGHVDEIFMALSDKIKEYETMADDLIATVWKNHAKISSKSIFIADSAFEAQNSPDVLLYHMLKPYGFNRPSTQAFKNYSKSKPGKSIRSDNWRLTREREGFVLEQINEKSLIQLQISGKKETLLHSEIEVSIKKVKPIDVDYSIRNTLYFDHKKCRFPLTLRNWKTADSIRPLGMKGRKKISDILTDKKIKNTERASQIVLCGNNGELMALFPSTCGEDYKIDNSSTSVLAVSLKIL